MAKKPPVVKSTASLVMVSGEYTVNGIRHVIQPVNYQRVEYEDGRVEEIGRPADLPADASIGDIMRAAFAPLAPAVPPKQIKRVIRARKAKP